MVPCSYNFYKMTRVGVPRSPFCLECARETQIVRKSQNAIMPMLGKNEKRGIRPTHSFKANNTGSQIVTQSRQAVWRDGECFVEASRKNLVNLTLSAILLCISFVNLCRSQLDN